MLSSAGREAFSNFTPKLGLGDFWIFSKYGIGIGLKALHQIHLFSHESSISVLVKMFVEWKMYAQRGGTLKSHNDI